MKTTYELELEHRLSMIQDDLKEIRKFIYKQNLVDTFHRPSQVSDEAWTLLNNIEIACDLTSSESLTWQEFNSTAVTNTWIDNNTGITYEGDKALVEFLRSQGDKIYNDVSDEYIINEAHSQGWIKLLN